MKRAAILTIAIVAACLPLPPQQQPAADPAAPTGDASAFAGTFAAKGATLELAAADNQISGTLRGAGMVGQVACVVDGNELSGEITMSDGSSGAFLAYPVADGIAIVVDGRQPIELKRTGGAPTANGDEVVAPDPASQRNFGKGHGRIPPTPPTPSPTKPAPKVKGKAAKGTAYRDDLDGWEVRTPSAWKYVVKGSSLVFGSDTEAGLIIVAFNRGFTYDQMITNVDSVIAQLGATQAGTATRFKAKGGKGLVVEMTGTAADGSSLHARAAGVAGKTGILTVTGITTPDKIADLRKRIDAIALSAKFFTPKASPAMQNLAGPWWHYHGNSTGDSKNGVSASYERTIELCADGTFFDSSESLIDSRAENTNPGSDYYGSSSSASRIDPQAGAGRWTATGDDASGRLRMVFHNGTVEEHAYVFQKRGGGDIELDGRWYGYSNDKGGQCR